MYYEIGNQLYKIENIRSYDWTEVNEGAKQVKNNHSSTIANIICSEVFGEVVEEDFVPLSNENTEHELWYDEGAVYAVRKKGGKRQVAEAGSLTAFVKDEGFFS